MTDTEISKYMALLLRHKPESAGLVLDEHGWADVTELLACIAENKEPISFDRLCEIVKNDNKRSTSRDFCTNQGCMFICQRIPIPRERSA